jgi:Phenylpropionate dioxygenase and related ring-hydroxylating dioxygenases, large terminal subunit
VNIPALEDTAAIPERAPLHRPAEVAEQDGMVWLAPEPPRAPIPDLHPGVPLGGDGVATVVLPVLAVEANAAILIDNFLDEAHLPFVHSATIGGAGRNPSRGPTSTAAACRSRLSASTRSPTSPTPRYVMVPGRRCSAAG